MIIERIERFMLLSNKNFPFTIALTMQNAHSLAMQNFKIVKISEQFKQFVQYFKQKTFDPNVTNHIH